MNETSPWDEDPHVKKSNDTSKSAMEHLTYITDVLSLPLGGAAILADILLIVVILRYRRLRNRTNFFLLNFAVFHIFYIVSTPVFYLILDLFYNGVLEKRWFCLWIRVENFAMALTVTFGAGFGLDITLEAYQPSWFSKYQERYIYLFSFFYFLHAMIYAIAGTICFKSGFNNDFNFYFLTVYYLLTMIVLLYLAIRNRSTKLVRRKEWILNISVILSLCWLPLFVFYNLMIIFRSLILWELVFLPEYLVCSISLIAVWRLWKSNKHFSVAFRRIFRRPAPLCDYEELFLTDDAGSK